MVRAECSAFLHVQFPQDTPKTSRLLTKEQTTPSHQKKKEGSACIVMILTQSFPYTDRDTKLCFQAQKAAFVLNISDNV